MSLLSFSPHITTEGERRNLFLGHRSQYVSKPVLHIQPIQPLAYTIHLMSNSIASARFHNRNNITPLTCLCVGGVACAKIWCPIRSYIKLLSGLVSQAWHQLWEMISALRKCACCTVMDSDTRMTPTDCGTRISYPNSSFCPSYDCIGLAKITHRFKFPDS